MISACRVRQLRSSGFLLNLLGAIVATRKRLLCHTESPAPVPMPPKPWKPPMDDETLDHDRAEGADQDDPRSQGQGPCEAQHRLLLEPADLVKEMANWGGNAYARWAECPVCAVRLGYWPKRGHTGKHRTQVNQCVVQLTNERIRSMNRWATCQAQLYKDTVRLVEAELKAEANRTGQGEPKQKQKPTATEATWPEGPETPSGPSASGGRPNRAPKTEGLKTTMVCPTAESTKSTQMNTELRDMAKTADELSRQAKKLFESPDTIG